MSHHIPASERGNMLRNFAALVTARLEADNSLVANQLNAMVDDLKVAAGEDPKSLDLRIAKQVEAGAIFVEILLKSLASRIDMTEAEIHGIIARAAMQADGMLPE